jgi:hypothetical protein
MKEREGKGKEMKGVKEGRKNKVKKIKGVNYHGY